EIGERHALRVAVVSLGDLLCFGFCADPSLVPDVQSMADAVGPEAATLVADVTRSAGEPRSE
ncbi:MAG TPA: WS/DGAT domain-containing protein, partial [Conexibacter sp.]